MIAVIDYGLGNVKAFANIYRELDVPFVIASASPELKQASRVILPGVGAFDQAMLRLGSSGMRDALEEIALHKKLPVLGVCVGMQILARSSEEGVVKGLGWIDGDVIKFRQPGEGHRISIPHMGWNTVRPAKKAELFDGLDEQSRFYFLHSYLFRCRRTEDILATTTYGGEFSCAINDQNIYGVQFHPEKSHSNGIRLLRNFSEL